MSSRVDSNLLLFLLFDLLVLRLTRTDTNTTGGVDAINCVDWNRDNHYLPKLSIKILGCGRTLSEWIHLHSVVLVDSVLQRKQTDKIQLAWHTHGIYHDSFIEHMSGVAPFCRILKCFEHLWWCWWWILWLQVLRDVYRYNTQFILNMRRPMDWLLNTRPLQHTHQKKKKIIQHAASDGFMSTLCDQNVYIQIEIH